MTQEEKYKEIGVYHYLANALGHETQIYVSGGRTKKYGETVSIRITPKAGRNENCSCGSGKKNKKCCNLKTKPIQ